MTMKQIISNHSGKISIGAFVLLLAFGNYYYRWHLKSPVPKYKSHCERKPLLGRHGEGPASHENAMTVC